MLYINTWGRVTNLCSLVINHLGWVALTMSGGHLVNETALGESFPVFHCISPSLTPILDTKIHLLLLKENPVKYNQSRLMIINGLHKKQLRKICHCSQSAFIGKNYNKVGLRFYLFFSPESLLNTRFYYAIGQENNKKWINSGDINI